VIAVKRILLVNAIITGISFSLDFLGVINLSFHVAIIGLFMGIIDILTFIWIWKRLKSKDPE